MYSISSIVAVACTLCLMDVVGAQDKVCLAESTNVNFSCWAHHKFTSRLCACVVDANKPKHPNA